MRHFDTHGIMFLYMGAPIRHRVHPKFADKLEEICEELYGVGVREIHTLGITNNRPIRKSHPSREHTSKHSQGFWPDYEAWEDGESGPRAVDVTLAIMADGKEFDVMDKDDRTLMVQYCEKKGCTVCHKTVDSGNHVHVEV